MERTQQSKVIMLQKFEGGLEPFPGAGFIYQDDVWDLNSWKTVASKMSANQVNFAMFPDWIKMSVKAYISWGWLAQDYSNSWIQTTLTNLRHLVKYLSQYRPEIRQLINLNEGAAKGFVLYLDQENNKERSYRIANDVGRFAKWARDQYRLSIPFHPQKYASRPDKRELEADAKKGEDKIIPTPVLEQLFAATGKRNDYLWKRWSNSFKSKRPRGPELLYLQVIKILCST